MSRRWTRAVEAAGVRLAAARPSGVAARLLRGVTRASDGARLWLGVAAVAAAAGGPAGRRVAARAVVALGATSAVVNGPVKLLVRRRRPGRWATAGVRRAGRAPRTSSFPSGHTASAFAFATAASLEAPVLAPPLIATAMVVGVSRLHGGHHFPSDVAAGAVLGAGAGLATGWAFARRETSPPPGDAPKTARPTEAQANLVAPRS